MASKDHQDRQDLIPKDLLDHQVWLDLQDPLALLVIQGRLGQQDPQDQMDRKE